METNIYLVGTEYQLILTLGIINNYHSNNCKNVVVRYSNLGGNRLNGLDFSNTEIDYYEIVYDYSNPPKELKQKLQNIIDLKPNKLYFFLENKFWLNYLFSRLKKNNTTIILGPDGMKAYNNKNYWTTRQRARMLLDGLKHTLKAGLLPSWPFVEKTYATSKYIDEVWVEHPEFYNNITNKKVVKFTYTIDQAFVDKLMKMFATKDDDFEIIRNEPVILFLDSSYCTKEYYNRTIRILEKIQEAFPSRKVLVKYHPLSSKEAKREFFVIKNMTEVNSSYPAELFIASAKDAIVVSMVSTSELFYNPNCKYYWIYQMYSDMYNYDTLQNPTNYIQVINSINQIGE